MRVATAVGSSVVPMPMMSSGVLPASPGGPPSWPTAARIHSASRSVSSLLRALSSVSRSSITTRSGRTIALPSCRFNPRIALPAPRGTMIMPASRSSPSLNRTIRSQGYWRCSSGRVSSAALIASTALLASVSVARMITQKRWLRRAAAMIGLRTVATVLLPPPRGAPANARTPVGPAGSRRVAIQRWWGPASSGMTSGSHRRAHSIGSAVSALARARCSPRRLSSSAARRWAGVRACQRVAVMRPRRRRRRAGSGAAPRRSSPRRRRRRGSRWPGRR
jgi:hypothetical protein